MVELIFYDKNGVAAAHLSDETLYTITGRVAGWIQDDSFYGINGEHRAWYLNGWLIDRSGKYLGYSERAEGGPVRPLSVKPHTSGNPQTPRPKKPSFGAKPELFTCLLSWADTNLADFLK